MGIPEVSIGPSRKARKKVSRKIKKAAQSYLAQKSISLEDLTQDQQDFVFKYIKKRRAVKWMVPFMFTISIVLGLACFLFLQRIMEIRSVAAPYEQLVVDANGIASVIERDEESKEDIRIYGFLCLILGAVIGGVLYSSASAFGGAIGIVISLRTDRKFLDAFLPPPGHPGAVPESKRVVE